MPLPGSATFRNAIAVDGVGHKPEEAVGEATIIGLVKSDNHLIGTFPHDMMELNLQPMGVRQQLPFWTLPQSL